MPDKQPAGLLGALDADDLRLVGQMTVLGDALDRLADRRFGGFVGDQDDGLLRIGLLPRQGIAALQESQDAQP